MEENKNQIDVEQNTPYNAPHLPFSLEGHWQPWYDDRRDYNTNAPSYYDYLANQNNIIKIIVDKINDLIIRDVKTEETNTIITNIVTDWVSGNELLLKSNVKVSDETKNVLFNNLNYQLSNALSVNNDGLFVANYDNVINDIFNILNNNSSKIEANTNHLKQHDSILDNLTSIGFDDKRILLATDNDERGYSMSNIPDYYRARIKTINSSLINSNFNFGFQTDTHLQFSSYAPNAIKHIGYLTALSRYGNLDAIVFNGDNGNGYYDKVQVTDEQRNFATTALYEAFPGTDVYLNIGNHDRGDGQNGKTGPSNTLTYADLRNIYGHNQNMFNEVRPDNASYCYKDYPNKKIRFIMLNSYDLSDRTNSDGTYKYISINQSGFSGAQLKWLAEQALQVPNDYQVIIVTHCPITGTLQQLSNQINGQQLLEILTRFNRGETVSLNVTNTDDWFSTNITADYTGKENSIVGVFSGHQHKDSIDKTGGITFCETRGSLCWSGDEGRDVNTYTEDAWDCISVNTSNRSVILKRFGAGEDRLFTY